MSDKMYTQAEVAELKQDLKDQFGWMEQSEGEAFVAKKVVQALLAESKVIEEIRQVASGERQVAADDTEGMAYIDKLCQKALAANRATPGKGEST